MHIFFPETLKKMYYFEVLGPDDILIAWDIKKLGVRK